MMVGACSLLLLRRIWRRQLRLRMADATPDGTLCKENPSHESTGRQKYLGAMIVHIKIWRQAAGNLDSRMSPLDKTGSLLLRRIKR